MNDSVLDNHRDLWEDDSHFDQSVTCSLTLQTAIAFHNLGVGYLCQSKANPRRVAHFRKMAIRFFKLSYALLVKQYQSTTSDNHAWKELGMPQLFVVVLTTLIRTLRDAQEHETANQLCPTLQNLRQVMADDTVHVIGVN